MAALFCMQDNLLRVATVNNAYLGNVHMRRTLGCLLGPRPNRAGCYNLSFAMNISATSVLLKRKVKYVSESESCDFSDTDENKYPPGKGYKVYEPRVVEFPSYAAMEEEKFWSELLAFPWQRGRTERFRRRLERKYFPKHCLDCMLLPEYRKKAAEASTLKKPSTVSSSSFSSRAGPAFPDDSVYRKLDYPAIAKALTPGAEGQESYRSQRSQPSSASRSVRTSTDSAESKLASSPAIRTIRSPLSGSPSAAPDIVHDEQPATINNNNASEISERRETSPSKEDGQFDLQHLENPKDDVNIQESSMPQVLTNGMVIPEMWATPTGTVILIDKPKGWTSFMVCAKIRSLVKVKKVGHAGTLDPMATGLLVVCVGAATKIVDRYQALSKVYTGTFRLGEATPSCDADSEVNERKPWTHITDAAIEDARKTFLGEIMQIPPMFSAIKVEGERLYEKARRGEQLDVPARRVTIYEFSVSRELNNRQEIKFYVRCSKGTYIRSLCADFARALGSCAHLTSLRRERIGKLCVDDAWIMEDLIDTYERQYKRP
ncbi:hypothetical protein KP509_07G028400 [Ceratopteris richardii]|uniref:tRNA pseudouridine(55) synthase n=1 Tax=Ceratopteris richardii TaxID=49495 RepID=A0A8T2U8J5_CERRI|nr:hypothetical protein KP509_07G028400 [Ceratopteris richardii]KAH7432571.1 hypothetical protein KP509_07G028400 [Ceratopteris richardii]